MAKKRMIAIQAAALIRRKTFDGMPIVDAKKDFTLVVPNGSVKTGTRKDPANCALANACREQVHASKVVFFRKTAYMDLPDPKGIRTVYRFLLGKDAVEFIKRFDRGETVKGNVTVTLKAPNPSRTLDANRKESRQRREKGRKALLRGELAGTTGNKATFAKKARISHIDVRNGTGLVHNVLKKQAS